MIKKFILVLAAAIALPVVANAQKFGVVNGEEVFNALPEVAQIQDQITQKSKSFEDEFKKLQDEFEKKFSEFQSLGDDTPDSIKERRMKELQELDQKMQVFRNTAQQDLQREQQTLIAPVEQKIMEAINSVGQEGGFTFIFPDGMASFVGKDVINVTADVKAKLGIK